MQTPMSSQGAESAHRRKAPFWRPRRIGWRLGVGFGALIVLMLLALGQASLQINRITNINQRFATGDMQRLLRVQALSLQTEGVGSALVRLMNAPREHRVEEYADVDQRNRNIDGIISTLSTEVLAPEQQETLKRLIACRAVYGQAFIDVVDQIEADDLKAAARELNEKVNPSLKAMLTESQTLLKFERENIEAELEDSQRQFAQMAMWVGGISVVAVALALWLGVRTTRSVVGPLEALEDAAQRIAQGDYASRVSSSRVEEVDRVGEALNTMTEAVAQREQQIAELAYKDTLTGLPNRTALSREAAQAPTPYRCVAMIDLARLKAINATLGYATGDTLIKELAQRAGEVMQQAVAAGHINGMPIAARLSGGTFAAAFNVASRTHAQALHEAMELAMREPVLCSGHSVDLNVVYGLADSGADGDALPLDTLLRNAEVALNAAKRGATGFAWYSEAQEAARLGHLSLVSDLRTAVAGSQLQMWLQPKFALPGGQAVGAEALVRWQHPQRGFVSPAEFIPFAEQTGYISMVTQWMLQEALRTLAQWARTQPDLSISVNISTRDLLDPQFCERLQDLLAQHQVDPSCLRLEIVESGLMEDPQTSVDVLHRLRGMGLELSIDDFGTGYSSMAYLQKLPVSELKIDRSFVDGLDHQSGSQRLVKTMIELGHGMGLMVTAEGVETEAEKATLITLGCDVMQGYLGSRPLHGAALQAWFDALPEQVLAV